MELRDRVVQLIEPLLESEGYELVDVEIKGGARRRIVSVYIHKPGGVTFRDCAEVSYAIQPVLEVNGVVSGNYTLEVASPGLDRPLKTEADFRRVIGERVRVTTSSPMGGSKLVSGELIAVENGEILLKVKRGKKDEETLRVPISLIVSGKVEIEF
jgi:ribosome maturation factor RimP